MAYGRQRTLQDIENFISQKRGGWLRAKLFSDLSRLRIIKEADIECAVYYHLRRYIGEDRRWRVLARKHVRHTGHYVDLLIFKKKLPRIAIELKWNQENIEKKDRDSLFDAITKLKVQKAYWISVSYRQKERIPLEKRPEEKYVLHRIVVRLGYTGVKLERFVEKRSQFMSQMSFGKGKRCPDTP
jgi:hypothetical protein